MRKHEKKLTTKTRLAATRFDKSFYIATYVVHVRNYYNYVFVYIIYLSRHYLKASISLTLVMGIAWLANLIVFLEELVAVAYIMTIFIAGQGILLFIILVPLSKYVRMHI